MEQNIYDVAIVGGGIMGSSSAYFLAKRMTRGKRRICVIERDPTVSMKRHLLSESWPIQPSFVRYKRVVIFRHYPQGGSLSRFFHDPRSPIRGLCDTQRDSPRRDRDSSRTGGFLGLRGGGGGGSGGGRCDLVARKQIIKLNKGFLDHRQEKWNKSKHQRILLKIFPQVTESFWTAKLLVSLIMERIQICIFFTEFVIFSSLYLFF